MDVLIHIIILFLIALFNPDSNGRGDPAFKYKTDRSVEVTVFMVKNDLDSCNGYYYCHLISPICMDELCNPIDIEVQWDLLGNFQRYIEHKEKPITKFDHQPFDSLDHVKLVGILSNKNSMFRDYSLKDLIDTTRLIYSEEVDGMTGATSKTFEDEIVPGAVYTCFTLWHFINGKVCEMILNYTKSSLDDNLVVQMLKSGNSVYQKFALQRENISPEITRAVASLIGTGNSYISIEAISRLPTDYLISDGGENIVGKLFDYSFPVQNALLSVFQERMWGRDQLRILIKFMRVATDNQKIMIANIFEHNKSGFTDQLKSQVREVLIGADKKLSGIDYKILDLLEIHF